MTILIRDSETDRLVRELASATGETITEAVRKAAEERLSRVTPRKGRVDRARLAELLDYFNSLPRQNEHLTDDEILGYNAEGHFD